MTAFIDSRISKGQADISADRPYEAEAAFETALGLSADPPRRLTCVLGLDRAWLTTGREVEAELQWKFERASAELPPRILAGFVENALVCGRYDVALKRTELVGDAFSEEDAWKFGFRSLLGLSELEAAYSSLDSVSGSMPAPQVARYRARGLFVEQRFKEVLDLIPAGMSGRSSELLRSRTRALIGTGQFGTVEKELAAQRVYYPDTEWIDYELARNATAARERELAVTRWLALVAQENAEPLHMRGLIEALLANLEVDRASEMISVAAKENRFNTASIRLFETQVARADGEATRALPALSEAIEEATGQVTNHTLSRLWLERSKLELSAFFGGAEDADWMARHVASARQAHTLDQVSLGPRTSFIEALIRSGAHSEAKAMIAAMPRNNRPETIRLRTWMTHKQDDLDGAKRLWSLRKRLHFFPQIENGASANLTRIDENPTPPSDGVILYTAMRDERGRLPWFFDYYRGLGITSFVVIDNGSTDGSLEYLRERQDVTLFSTPDSYVAALAGMVWINHLKSLFSRSGWALYVDADEALVYDGCETHSIPDLVESLELEGAEAFAGYMLDMFARDAMGPGDESTMRPTDFVSRYPWYLPNIRRNPAMVCPYRNTCGGARTVFSTGEELTKTPLIKSANGIAFLRSSHTVSPARLSEREGVLLHFKMTDSLLEEAQAVLTDKSRSLDCQLRYRKYLAADNVAELLGPYTDKAVRYVDSASLVTQGLMPAFDWS